MNYQGEQVNFSQTSSTEMYLTRELGRTNQNVSDNRKFINTYPQIVSTASSRSDSDIWKWLAENITGKSSQQTGGNDHYSWAANPNAALPQIIKQMTTNKNKNTSQDESIVNNKMQIEAMNERLSRQVVELGNALSGKAGVNHSHGGGTTPPEDDCGWFGEKCWDNPFEKLFPTVPMTAILAAGGLGAYLLLRKK